MCLSFLSSASASSCFWFWVLLASTAPRGLEAKHAKGLRRNRNSNKLLAQKECTIMAMEYLAIEGGPHKEMKLDCELDPEDAGGISGIIVPLVLSPHQRAELLGMIYSGEVDPGVDMLDIEGDEITEKQRIKIDPIVRMDSKVSKAPSAKAQHQRRLVDTKSGKTHAPTNPPTPNPVLPTLPPTAPPTSPPPCPSGQARYQVTVKTYDYPAEKSYTLTNMCSNDVILSESNFQPPFQSEAVCADAGEMSFVINDTSGDGICCMFMFGQGWYTVTEDGVEKAAGGFFVESETTIWGSCAPAPPCPSGQARYQVTVKTDYHPEETSYTLTNTCSNAIILSESNFSSPYYTFRSEAVCADAGEMSFVINDSYGDGICCSVGQGGYTVTEDGVEKAAGGVFIESETTIWGSCAPAPPCPSGQARYQVTVKTDNYPQETSYTLTNTCSNAIILSESNFSSPNYTFRSEAVCANAGEMSFVINDSMFGQGGYTVTEDGVEKAAGGFFVESETTIWGSCAPAPPCPSGQARYQVTVKTDYHPGDTTYTLKNTCSNAIILSESNFSSPYYTFRSEAVCADAGEMSFVINDSEGDGICCSVGEGGYTVTEDGVEKAAGGAFEGSETKTWGTCASAPTPPPTTLPPTAPPTNSKAGKRGKGKRTPPPSPSPVSYKRLRSTRKGEIGVSAKNPTTRHNTTHMLMLL